MDKLDKKYIKYLDDLRESGIINMMGAVPYLQNAFPDLSKQEARKILFTWMDLKSKEG